MDRLEAYQKGLTDKEAAQVLNMLLNTFITWRRRRGLKPNYAHKYTTTAYTTTAYERDLVNEFMHDLAMIANRVDGPVDVKNISLFMECWRKFGGLKI